MTNAHPLSRARAEVAAASGKFEAGKKAFHKAENTHRIAQSAVGDETYARNLALSRGGPRPAPGFKAPPTAAEVTATTALEKLTAAEIAHGNAAAELKRAEAALLAAENSILDRWRTLQALAIQSLQREDAPAEVIAEKLAELRVMCPPDSAVRLHQHFTLSALVRDVLGDDPTELKLDVPVDQLRGDNHWDYETKRAEILAQSESAHHQPLEAA